MTKYYKRYEFGDSGYPDDARYVDVTHRIRKDYDKFIDKKWFVYTIESRLGKSYTNITTDISDKLHEHNNGDIQTTRDGAPWQVVDEWGPVDYLQAKGLEAYKNKTNAHLSIVADRCTADPSLLDSNAVLNLKTVARGGRVYCKG